MGSITCSSGIILLIGIVIFSRIGSSIDPKTSLKEKAAEKGRVRRDSHNAESGSPGTTGDDEENENNRPDPFPLSIEWANFVHRMDEISEHLKTKTEKLIALLSDKNPDYAANRTAFLGNFLTGFHQEFKPLVDIFVPLQEQLDLNKAYTVFDPAVGLETLDKCKALAKAKPTKDIDKGRLKWIEVNALAATLHHIFNRLTPEFEQYGLGEISEALHIQYPSWTTIASQNESGNTYEDMVAADMVEYINTEINSLGDPNHLIRLLERLLQKKLGLKGWDPSHTNLNKYCYGNNLFGLIHDKFDVLIDAAQYLVMSDMKYALIQIIDQVYNAYQAEMAGAEKVNLVGILEETFKNMTGRIDKKIKFSKLAEIHPDVVVVPGPTVFRCDPLPAGCDGVGPKVTAPNCPPGIYMQNWTAYADGKALKIPTDVSESLKLKDGSSIGCLALEHVALSSNGSLIPCKIVDKTCVDGNGTQIKEPYTLQIVPVFVDLNMVPYHRDMLIETYPDKPQWGKFDCTSDPDHPASPPTGPVPAKDPDRKPEESDGTKPTGPTEPATGPTLPPPELNCTVGPNDKGIGYIDCRPPGLNDANTAEFTLAFPGYLESELVLNPDGKCIGTCREYRNPTPTCTNKTTHCELYRKSHCEDKESDCMKHSECPNKAKRCIRTSKEVTFCPSAPGTGRVYDWYTIDGQPHQASSLRENNPGKPAIDITKCSTDKIMKANERWEMEEGVVLNTPQYCELCMCVCSDPMVPEGHHFFDIAEIRADTEKGFVVVGLRFERKNNTLFLNIQQGKILPDGKLDQESVVWLDPAAHTPHLVPLGVAGFDKLNLDVIEPGKPNDVLTGIQWKIENHALTLEAGFSTFDGAVTGPPSFRGAKFPPPKEKRDRHDLGETVSPMKQHGPSQPYPITDNSKYIEFDASSLEKDGGQAVVPFFDLQPMRSPDGPYRPLKNVGILYKSKLGSGGFITTSAKF